MPGRASSRLCRLLLLICAGALCLGGIWATHAEGVSFTFTKIVDTDTAIPGGGGNFGFFTSFSFDGSTVVFVGSPACSCSTQLGVYASVGGVLQKIANSSTVVPDGTGNFNFFAQASIDAGTLAFRGDGPSSTGIYASTSGGALTKVADQNTPIPGGTGTFQAFGPAPSVDGERIVFNAVGPSSQRGIYSFTSGSVTKLVDTNTPIPGGTGNFGFLFSPGARDGNLVFGGSPPIFANGIYTIIGGSLAKAVDINTPIPGGSGNFGGFGSPGFDGNTVAFLGNDPTFLIQGIYTVDTAGTVTLIADMSTPVPGGTGNFIQFSPPVIDSGNLVFIGIDSAFQSGLYRAAGSVLTRIIGAGDMLDGKVVAGAGIAWQARLDRPFAIAVTFADDNNSQGIFIATETQPSAAFLHRIGSSLVLDDVGPVATAPAFQDSAAIKFSGGNPWKEVGTWSTTATFANGTLGSLSPLQAWLGLKSSDDTGTRFDVRAEVFRNGVLVGSGEAFCITGVARNPAQALEASVPLGLMAPTQLTDTDVLSLRVLTRIGTNGSGGFCGGHSSATGLRLYFDAVSRASRFGVGF